MISRLEHFQSHPTQRDVLFGLWATQRNIPAKLRPGLDNSHGQKAADAFEVSFERITEVNSV